MEPPFVQAQHSASPYAGYTGPSGSELPPGALYLHQQYPGYGSVPSLPFGQPHVSDELGDLVDPALYASFEEEQPIDDNAKPESQPSKTSLANSSSCHRPHGSRTLAQNALAPRSRPRVDSRATRASGGQKSTHRKGGPIPFLQPCVERAYVNGLSYGADSTFTKVIVNDTYQEFTQGLAWGKQMLRSEKRSWSAPAVVTLSCHGLECSRKDSNGTQCSGKVSLAESLRRVHDQRIADFTCLCESHLDKESYAWVVHCTECVKEDPASFRRANIRQYSPATGNQNWSRCTAHHGRPSRIYAKLSEPVPQSSSVSHS